jgi:hypothetical protein
VAELTEYVQFAAACVTVNVCPAMLIVPVRSAGVGFGMTVYPAEPFPVPACPNEIVIHGTLLVTAPEQFEALAEIAMSPVPPVEGNVLLDGEIEKVHCAASGWVRIIAAAHASASRTTVGVVSDTPILG